MCSSLWKWPRLVKPADCCANEGLCGRRPSQPNQWLDCAQTCCQTRFNGNRFEQQSGLPNRTRVTRDRFAERPSCATATAKLRAPTIFGGRNRSVSRAHWARQRRRAGRTPRQASWPEAAGDDEPRNAGEAGGVRSDGWTVGEGDKGRICSPALPPIGSLYGWYVP